MSSQRNTSQLRIVLVFLLLGLVLSAPALSHPVYIGPMTSQTVSPIPSDRSRTTIGTGEQVVCSVDAGTWSDPDTCNGVPYQDTIGDCVWLCTSGASLSTSGGVRVLSSTLWAGYIPTGVNVYVIVFDAGREESVVRSKSFNIIAPEHIDVVGKLSDNGFPPPGNDMVGASTTYQVQVTPTTVSFYNFNFFREHIPYQVFPPYPNGSPNLQTAEDKPFLVGFDNCRYNGDTIKDGPMSKYYLSPDGQRFVDYDYTMNWVDQWCDGNGTWHFIGNMTTTTIFMGSLLKCQEIYNGMPGSQQGPWQQQ